MIENYVNLIKLLGNNFDGIMIVDKELIIKHYYTFSSEALENVDLKTVIGKTPFEIFSNVNKRNSTLYKAVKYGKISLNNIQTLNFCNGKKELILDNTIPIIENGEIIGAINTVKYISKMNSIDKFKEKVHKLDLFTISDIIGTSEKIFALKKQIIKIAKTSSNVLIFGETGTGKEMVAQSIHMASERKNKLFIAQNCAAIPENLFESIFFGTTKGSFTDAINKIGLFEIANGGTLFLDELNSMPLNLQAKLLKIIEDQKVTKLGEYEPKSIDVRIITAFNENPILAIENKKIRGDLYYRISTIQLNTPTLKEIKDDIPVLTQHFLNYYNKKFNMNIVKISKEVLELFFSYHWPGNIRELKNVIEYSFNFTENNIINLEDIPEYLKFTNIEISKNFDLMRNIEVFEKNFITEAALTVKNYSELSNILNISKQLLSYKVNKFNLKDSIKFKLE